MDWEPIAPMIVFVTFSLSIAAVLIFRPLTKRLGDLIEITGRNRQAQAGGEDLARLTEVVGHLADRIEHLEQRQDFSERMLASLDRPATEARAKLQEPADR
jgi:hypothetical protein